MEQGGSTITQQFAKIAFSGNERTYGRKVREAIIALRLEKHHSKDAILSAYLSRVYFGDGVYGLSAAARRYFDKDAPDLGIEEAAMLAGVVNAPSRLAPSRHPAEAAARAKLVVAAMVDAGYITPEAAAAVPSARPRPAVPSSSGRYFADWIAPQASASLGLGVGQVAVQTTLDSKLQGIAEEVVEKALAGEGAKAGANQAGLVVMRRDGSVVAMVGGRDYAESQFNRAVQAQRQPGSAFKLFVYLAALRAGANGATVVSDVPLDVEGWSPKNYGERYGGQLPLTQAFAQSSNVAAVRLSERVGRENVIQAARDLGLGGDIEPQPSMALGTSATTLLELTAAYASVAAGAYPVAPVGLAGQGIAMLSQTTMPHHEQASLLEMLNATVETGTGRNALIPIRAYAKTGTTQDHRDAWFIGFAGDLIVGVWVGNDDETPMKGVTGGGLPARIWRDYMTQALSDDIAAASAARAEAEAQSRRREEEGHWYPAPPEWWERLFRGIHLSNQVT